MADHLVIAYLNDAQFSKLEQSQIPYRELAAEVLTIVKQKFSNQDLTEITEAALKVVLKDQLMRAWNQARESQTAQERAAEDQRLNGILGL